MVLALVLLTPASASALNPSECARLLKQIYHYDSMRERANGLGNTMWSSRMQIQTDLLRERYDGRCEDFHDDDRALRAAMVLKVGAKAAAKFFTMGAL
jgi:hypothetical protein